MKKFNEFINESTKENDKLMDYHDAYRKFIKDRKVGEYGWEDKYRYFDTAGNPVQEYSKGVITGAYGYFLKLSNGYTIYFHGGGCSGEDCNSSWILDKKGKLIAEDHTS